MTDVEITSPANPRIKQLVALRRRRVRDEAGVTLVEGYEELELALAAGIKPRQIFISPEIIDKGQQRLAEVAAERGAEVFQVSPAAFKKIAYRESPDGWLAVVPAVGGELAGLELGANPLVVICLGVEKPGNLGAILRTADAAGVAAVIATDPVTDWGNPNVIRASKGTVFSVPVAACELGAGSWLAGGQLDQAGGDDAGGADVGGGGRLLRADGDRGRLGEVRAPR